MVLWVINLLLSKEVLLRNGQAMLLFDSSNFNTDLTIFFNVKRRYLCQFKSLFSSSIKWDLLSFTVYFSGRLNDTQEPNETCKQDHKETESCKQQPERSESCIQDSGRIETCKEESDETNSPKRQHGMSNSCTQDLDEIKLIKPPERSDSCIQELGQKTNCGHKLEKNKSHEKQESKVGITSFLNIHQNVDISHSSVLSLLRARINSKIQQDFDRQDTNDRKVLTPQLPRKATWKIALILQLPRKPT